MGGRGGASSLSGEEYGRKIVVQGYEIDAEKITTPSGNTAYLKEFKEPSEEQKRHIEQSGRNPNDYVIMGNLAVPKAVAQAANAEKKRNERLFQKNVPGLSELLKAIDYDSGQRRKFYRSLDSGTGVIKGTPYSKKADELRKKYPRASAYLQAESYYQSSHYMKSAYGKEAMNKIASGRPYKKVLEEMRRKWRAYTSKNAD